VQHAQIHRLVSVGHRLLCEKILTVKKPCRPIIEHASLFSHFCFRCERRCGRSSPPLCFSYPRRPSLLVPVNTRARTYCDLLTFSFFLLHQQQPAAPTLCRLLGPKFQNKTWKVRVCFALLSVAKSVIRFIKCHGMPSKAVKEAVSNDTVLKKPKATNTKMEVKPE